MVPWGEDAHLSVCEGLSWVDLARLKCVNRVYHAATRHSTAVNATVWWGQAQSTEQDMEELVPSLVRQRKVGALSFEKSTEMIVYLYLDWAKEIGSEQNGV